MALPVGTIIEVTVRGSLYNQITMNTHHVYVASQGETPDPIQEVGHILDEYTDMSVGSFMPAYLAAVPTQLTVVEVTAQVVAAERLRRQRRAVGESGLAGSTLVTNVQASITFTTRLSGRDQVGGVRIPASPTDAVGGLWQAGYLTALTTLGSEYASSFTEPDGTAIYQPCIYHRGKAPPANRTDVAGVIAQPTTRVIRRRTVGLGV